jgi:transposase
MAAATVSMEEHEALRAKYDALRSELEQLKRLVFGSRSERTATVGLPGQMGLFGDIPQAGPAATGKEAVSYERNKKRKAHPGRNALPDHLPVRETVIEPEGDTAGLKKIGEEITETLEYTPASLVKVRTIRPKYAKAGGEGVMIAPLPERPLPKAVAEASLLAHILVSKYIDHLPFYRQAKIFKRDFRWEPAPSTLSDWMAGCCRLLEPLYDRLKQKILASGYVQADESPIKVLESEKRGSSHRGYHWVYHDPVGRLVLFDYRKGRGQHGPKELLTGYRGILQCDGYTVYDKIGTDPSITLAGCLAHARRKFREALDSDPERAEWALAKFADIYGTERRIKENAGSGPDARKAVRTEKILPLLAEIKERIGAESIKVLPKSPIGKAMAYFLNQWPKFAAIFGDGRIELDNNLIENAIRPLALGRRNYLFAGSHKAARHAAMLYSFFGSCKMQGTNPMEWLTDTLGRLPGHNIQRLDELLPGRRP